MIILFTSSSEHQLTLFTKTDIPDLQTDVHITDLETRLPTGWLVELPKKSLKNCLDSFH